MHLFYVTHDVDVTVGYYARHQPVPQNLPYRFHLPQQRPVSAGEDAQPPDAGKSGGEDATYRITLRAPRDGVLSTDRIYLAYHRVFFYCVRKFQEEAPPERARLIQLISHAAEDGLLETPNMPSRIGGEPLANTRWCDLEEWMAARPQRARVRVAVLNGIHLAFGDTLAHLVVLRTLYSRLRKHFVSVEVDLFQHHCNLESEMLYRRSGMVSHIHYLPAPLSALRGYDGFIDMCDWRASATEHWVDHMLWGVGIEPSGVPAPSKRMWLPSYPERNEALVALLDNCRRSAQRVLLFHPRTSMELRSCPRDEAVRLIRELIERTDYVVACVEPLPISHPRYLDCSHAVGCFDDLTHLVRVSEAVVTADTCVYHIADAFNVPCVAVFTSIDPALRTRYYPRVVSLSLSGPADAIRGLHGSRDPSHIATAHAMWRDLRAQALLSALERAAAGMGDGATCALDNVLQAT